MTVFLHKSLTVYFYNQLLNPTLTHMHGALGLTLKRTFNNIYLSMKTSYSKENYHNCFKTFKDTIFKMHNTQVIYKTTRQKI